MAMINCEKCGDSFGAASHFKEHEEVCLLRQEIEKLKWELTEANIRGDNASMHYQGIAARKLEEASETKNNYWILLTHAQALAEALEKMLRTVTAYSDTTVIIKASEALAAWKEFKK